MKRYVCISDTHMTHRDHVIPDGDVLIHAGDFTHYGTQLEVSEFNRWLGELPHTFKVVICGNHELGLQRYGRNQIASLLYNATDYLSDSHTVIDDHAIWGMPWTDIFGQWAYMATPNDMKDRVIQIPEATRILVTHGPPYGILDRPPRRDHAGNSALIARVMKIKPKVHIFGHIHEGYGETHVEGTHFINASLEEGPFDPPDMKEKLPITFDL